MATAKGTIVVVKTVGCECRPTVLARPNEDRTRRRTRKTWLKSNSSEFSEVRENKGPENRGQRARRRGLNRLTAFASPRQIGVPSMAKRTRMSHPAQSDSPSIFNAVSASVSATRSSWWSGLFSSSLNRNMGGLFSAPAIFRSEQFRICFLLQAAR